MGSRASTRGPRRPPRARYRAPPPRENEPGPCERRRTPCAGDRASAPIHEVDKQETSAPGPSPVPGLRVWPLQEGTSRTPARPGRCREPSVRVAPHHVETGAEPGSQARAPTESRSRAGESGSCLTIPAEGSPALTGRVPGTAGTSEPGLGREPGAVRWAPPSWTSSHRWLDCEGEMRPVCGARRAREHRPHGPVPEPCQRVSVPACSVCLPDSSHRHTPRRTAASGCPTPSGGSSARLA